MNCYHIYFTSPRNRKGTGVYVMSENKESAIAPFVKKGKTILQVSIAANSWMKVQEMKDERKRIARLSKKVGV